MSRYIFDIETTGLLNHTTIDYKTLPFKLKAGYKIHCAVFKDIDTGEKFKFTPDTVTKIPRFIAKKVTWLAGHNIISFDLLVLKLYFGVDYTINWRDYNKCSIGGKTVAIVDTLVLSQYLNPDRLGGHSLRAWGERLHNHKGDYGEEENAWDSFSQEMLEYCEQDVDLNHDLYDSLMDEWGQWDHHKAFSLEQAVNEVVARQSHVGFRLDVDKAKAAVADLNSKMRDIERKVEPNLPLINISKTDANNYRLPARQVKKDGTLTSYMESFCEKHGGETYQDEYGDWHIKVYGKDILLPCEERKPLVTKAPMRLANQKQMKQYLVHLGWEPIEWNERDITLKSGTKIKLPYSKYQEAVLRYCEDTAKSHFKKARFEHLRVRSIQEMYDSLMNKPLDKPVKVLTSPKYTIDQEKTICPNLERLGEKADWVKDVVYWLTYRHRRNAIKSPNKSGFLTHPRLEVDGRVPTDAQVTGTNTYRFKHRFVANIPRVTSIYGRELRELFACDEDMYQVGCDASGLEARVQGHYCYPYTDGDLLAELLVAEKPNDVHSVRARELGISRDAAKSVGYASMYGCQPPKLKKMLGITLNEAKRIHKEYWESMPSMLELKAKVEAYWEKTDKRYIKGIDNRKVMTRSKHSLLNALFQSCGMILMKYAIVMFEDTMREKGLLFHPFEDDSWQGKAGIMIIMHDEGQMQVCPSLVDGDKSVVGDLFANSITKAGQHLKLRVPFPADYDVGKNWGDCH